MHAVLDVQKNRYIGVDVGGTRLKLGVVSGRGAVSEVENIPTPRRVMNSTTLSRRLPHLMQRRAPWRALG